MQNEKYRFVDIQPKDTMPLVRIEEIYTCAIIDGKLYYMIDSTHEVASALVRAIELRQDEKKAFIGPAFETDLEEKTQVNLAVKDILDQDREIKRATASPVPKLERYRAGVWVEDTYMKFPQSNLVSFLHVDSDQVFLYANGLNVREATYVDDALFEHLGSFEADRVEGFFEHCGVPAEDIIISRPISLYKDKRLPNTMQCAIYQPELDEKITRPRYSLSPRIVDGFGLLTGVWVNSIHNPTEVGKTYLENVNAAMRPRRGD